MGYAQNRQSEPLNLPPAWCTERQGLWVVLSSVPGLVSHQSCASPGVGASGINQMGSLGVTFFAAQRQHLGPGRAGPTLSSPAQPFSVIVPCSNGRDLGIQGRWHLSVAPAAFFQAHLV